MTPREPSAARTSSPSTETHGGESAGRARGLFSTMLTIRAFEDKVSEAFLRGLVFGTTHLCQGQEAVSAGAVAALGPDDSLTYTYRGHGQVIARGMDLAGAFAEIFGREAGSSRGLGGSMHLADAERGLLGSFAIVGGGLPVAVGAAISAQLAGRGQAAMTFFGDGATNIGAFHESMNLAAVWKLPIVFVCENNLYGEYSPILTTTPFEDLVRRADAYAMRAEMVDGNDVFKVLAAARAAVDRARRGEGPTFLECKTYRHKGHSRSDPAKYRPPGELELWLGRDPIGRCEAVLKGDFDVSDADIDAIRQDVRAAIDAAFRAACDAPVSRSPRSVARNPGGGVSVGRIVEMTYREAIIAAQRDALQADPRVVLMGEDVGPAGGVFKTSAGLFEAFGPERVRDTPISEQAFVGAAVGMALTGYRPIVELMFADFMAVCFDQIVNTMAKHRFMLGGRLELPLVVRALGGGGARFGAQHSQTGETWLLSTPGLKVLSPSTPNDAYRAIRSAVLDPNPVIVLEHKALFMRKGEVDLAVDLTLPIRTSEVLRLGGDLTVVGSLGMVERVTAAAGILASRGISVEVIDLRSVRPLNTAPILASVRKTGRLLTVEENHGPGGWGAEVIATVVGQAMGSLRSPPQRLHLPDWPMPYSPALEDAAIPSVDRIVDLALRMTADQAVPA